MLTEAQIKTAISDAFWPPPDYESAFWRSELARAAGAILQLIQADDSLTAHLRRIAVLETALADLMRKAADHIIAGHPANADALAALREAERVLTDTQRVR